MDVGEGGAGERRRVGRHGCDVAIALGLTIASFLLRRDGLPSEGLWYDDAWVAMGAVKGSISQIPMTGGAHPGYTLLLWLQHRLVGGDVDRLVLLTFLFGVVGPAVVYACLRSLRYGRAGSLFAAAAVVVTSSHITYSGRVKSYTLDVALVAVLAALLPRLAERRWTWAVVAAWVAFAVSLGSISGYVMLATAVAIGILVLHPHGDRRRRAVALAAQGVVQGGSVLYARRFVDLDQIEAFMESFYDAHIERSANPLILGRNLSTHMERVVDVHPGGPEALLGVISLVVLGGLVLGALGALDRRRTIVSRFALAALSLAAVGALLDRFPFGPRTFDVATALGAPGARHTLWLAPITAIGLCNVVDRLLAVAGTRTATSNALRGIVVLGTTLLVMSRWEPTDPYLGPGRRQHAAVIDQAAERGAFIVLDEQTSYQYLLLTVRPMELVPTPEEMIGFAAEPEPGRGVVLRPAVTPENVAEVAVSADHDLLVVYAVDIPYGAPLLEAGWTRVSTEEAGGMRVTVWRRPPRT